MNDKPTFRLMRQTVRECIAQIGLLLMIEQIEWPDDLYALFLGMAKAQKKLDNPTREQYRASLGAWLRVYRRVLEMMPEDHVLRLAAQPEFERISKPFKGLLDVATVASVEARTNHNRPDDSSHS